MGSTQQQTEKSIFVNVMESSGWNASIWDHHFESGAKLPYAGHAQRLTGNHNMVVEYHGTARYVAIYIADRATFRYEKYRFYYPTGVEAIVKLIVKHQAELESGLKKLLPLFAPLCTSIQPEGDDGKPGAIVQLSVPYFSYQTSTSTSTSTTNTTQAAVKKVAQKASDDEDADEDEEENEDEDEEQEEQDEDSSEDSDEEQSEDTEDESQETASSEKYKDEVDDATLEEVPQINDLRQHLASSEYEAAIIDTDKIAVLGYTYNVTGSIAKLASQAPLSLFHSVACSEESNACANGWYDASDMYYDSPELAIACYYRMIAISTAKESNNIGYMLPSLTVSLRKLQGQDKYQEVIDSAVEYFSSIETKLRVTERLDFARFLTLANQPDRAVEVLQSYLQDKTTTKIGDLETSPDWTKIANSEGFQEIIELNNEKKISKHDKAKQEAQARAAEGMKKREGLLEEFDAAVKANDNAKAVQLIDKILDIPPVEKSELDRLSPFISSVKIDFLSDTPLAEGLTNPGMSWEDHAHTFNNVAKARCYLRSLVGVDNDVAQDLYSLWSTILAESEESTSETDKQFFKQKALSFYKSFPPTFSYSMCDSFLLLLRLNEKDEALSVLKQLLTVDNINNCAYLRNNEEWEAVRGNTEFETTLDQCVERYEQQNQAKKKKRK